MGEILAFSYDKFNSGVPGQNGFDQKYKFSNKNGGISKMFFPRPLFIIIYRPEMLKFYPYLILTGDTRVEFVICCVLRTP